MAEMSIPILVDWESIKDYLAKADIVEVIRCKDCKHYSKEDEICLDMFGGSCNEDGYCSLAERETESRECDTCPEYKDYHCEKWCTVIRQTIADMEEDWIPIDFIESKKEKLIKRRDKYEPKSFRWLLVQYDIDALDELMIEWEQEKKNDQTD